MNKRLIYIKKLTMLALSVSLYIISGLYIKINIPPVPFSTLTLFCTLSAMLLGKFLGPVSVLIYIAMGLCGLPIFAKGLGGPSYVLQPSFGYLIGFVIAEFVVGLLVEKIKDTDKIKNEKLEMEQSKAKQMFIRFRYSNITKRLGISLLGLLIVYVVGVSYFCLIQTFYFGEGVDFAKVIVSFVLIFIPSDFMWCVLASVIAGRIQKALKIGVN